MLYSQFKRLVVEVLNDMGTFSDQAVMAICMIVAHESDKCKYLWQYPSGPARGIVQMEGWVHDSVWENSDSIKVNGDRININKDIKQLTRSLEYNIFMARQRLLMDINPLPNDKVSMSIYINNYWNGGGKASPKKYLIAYNDWCIAN